MAKYKRIKFACYLTNVAMAAVGILSPLLFETFRNSYDISYTLLGLLVVINFNQNESRYCEVKISEDALEYMRLRSTVNSQQSTVLDIFTGEKIEYDLDEVSTRGIAMTLEPCGIKILKL